MTDVLEQIALALEAFADEAERQANAPTEERTHFIQAGRDGLLMRAAAFREAREVVRQTAKGA